MLKAIKQVKHSIHIQPQQGKDSAEQANGMTKQM